jgi:hypothetical protein
VSSLAFSAFGAAAAICLGIVIMVSTSEGTVKLEFPDAAAVRQCTVAIDGNEIRIEKFNGGRSFGIGMHRVDQWIDLAGVDSPQSYDDFFDFQFSAVGDTLTLFANGQQLLRIQDSSHTGGNVGIGALGSGSFTDAALFIPSKASLVADNRELVGPFADAPALEELCTQLLAKEPDNLGLT